MHHRSFRIEYLSYYYEEKKIVPFVKINSLRVGSGDIDQTKAM